MKSIKKLEKKYCAEVFSKQINTESSRNPRNWYMGQHSDKNIWKLEEIYNLH